MMENILIVILVLAVLIGVPVWSHYLTNMITSGFYDARARYIKKCRNIEGGNDGKEEE